MKFSIFLKILFYAFILVVSVNDFFNLGLLSTSTLDLSFLYIILIYWEVTELNFKFEQWINSINRNLNKDK